MKPFKVAINPQYTASQLNAASRFNTDVLHKFLFLGEGRESHNLEACLCTELALSPASHEEAALWIEAHFKYIHERGSSIVKPEEELSWIKDVAHQFYQESLPRTAAPSALDPAIQNIDRLVDEYKVNFVDLGTSVRFRIWEEIDGNVSPNAKFYFEQSHFFEGPNQGGPHITSEYRAATKEDALRLGIETILSHYKPTIGRHSPSEKWLTPNPRF